MTRYSGYRNGKKAKVTLLDPLKREKGKSFFDITQFFYNYQAQLFHNLYKY